MTAYSLLLAVSATLVAVGAGAAQNAAELPATQVVPLSPANLYRGWLASHVIGQKVVSKADHDQGRVRNLLVGTDGQIEAFVVEGNGTSEAREFVFRIPWQRIVASALPRQVVTDVTDGRQPTHGIFPGRPGIPEQTTEFAVSAVLGDYARLQAGQGVRLCIGCRVFARGQHVRSARHPRGSRRRRHFGVRIPGVAGCAMESGRKLLRSSLCDGGAGGQGRDSRRPEAV